MFDQEGMGNIFERMFGGVKPSAIPGAPASVQPKFFTPTRNAAQAPAPKLYSCDEERIKDYIDNQLQTVPFWAAEEQSIKNLKQACNFLGVPTTAFSEKKEFVEAIKSRRNKECSVCLSSFLKDEEVKVTLCGHLYHEDCLQGSARIQARAGFMPKCPMCRVRIDTESKRAQEVTDENKASEESRKRRRV